MVQEQTRSMQLAAADDLSPSSASLWASHNGVLE